MSFKNQIIFGSRLTRLVLTGIVVLSAIVFPATVRAQPDPNEVGLQPRGVPTVAEGKAAWQKVLVGEELSTGKEVQFFPKPDYHLTLDDKDPFDLTDGKLASKNNDRIWFQKDAVGWYLTPGEDVSLMVDLGKEEEVGRVAIRVLGGREQGSLVFPKAFEILASNDGQQFYSLSSMQKLQPAESELSDFKTTFYLPEEGKAYMHAFVFDTNVKARYIAIRMTRDAGIFTDELSIQRVTKPGTAKPLADYRPARFYTKGLVVLPRKDPMAITENIVTPNYFVVQDNTDGKATNNADFLIDMPEGVELVSGVTKFTSQPAFRQGERRYQVEMEMRSGKIRPRLGPLYFKVSDKSKIPANSMFRITTRVGGIDSNMVEVPLHIMTIPEVDTHGVLDVSLTWMNEGNEMSWPDFLTSFRKLGFDYVSAFPRWYRTTDGKMGLDASYDVGLAEDNRYPKVLQEIRAGSAGALALLDSARKQHFRVIANDSPFHILGQTLDTALKADKLSEAEQREIFNVVDGKVGKYTNPLYRGRFFQNEISRIKAEIEVTKPDDLYLDIEWWYESVDESQRDERVVAAWKASGKTWDDFRSDMGTSVLREVRKAVDEAAQSAGIAKPKIGLYNSYASGPQVQKFFEFAKLYPEIIQYSMPSLYVQGRTLDVIAKIRADHSKLGNKDIIPWLTAGTYGEFDPENMETMVLESVLNGARGVTYYYFYDFDPMDFYYHAKALSLLMKYPELVKDGSPKIWTGSNPNLNYTAFGTGKEVLLLVGNYKRSRDGKCAVPIPLAHVGEVKNVVTGTMLKPGKELHLDVPPGNYILVHVHS